MSKLPKIHPMKQTRLSNRMTERPPPRGLRLTKIILGSSSQGFEMGSQGKTFWAHKYHFGLGLMRKKFFRIHKYFGLGLIMSKTYLVGGPTSDRCLFVCIFNRVAVMIAACICLNDCLPGQLVISHNIEVI